MGYHSIELKILSIFDRKWQIENLVSSFYSARNVKISAFFQFFDLDPTLSLHPELKKIFLKT